ALGVHDPARLDLEIYLHLRVEEVLVSGEPVGGGPGDALPAGAIEGERDERVRVDDGRGGGEARSLRVDVVVGLVDALALELEVAGQRLLVAEVGLEPEGVPEGGVAVLDREGVGRLVEALLEPVELRILGGVEAVVADADVDPGLAGVLEVAHEEGAAL